MIDVIDEYTVYPLLKYHSFGVKNIQKSTQIIPNIVPGRTKFRNNEVLQLEPDQNLIMGNSSLRQSYEKLILACGLEADYTTIPGLLYSLDDKTNPIFSVYEYEKMLPKMANYSVYLTSLMLPESEYKVSIKNDNFYRMGGGNIVFSNCTDDIYEIFYSFEMILLLFEIIKSKRSKDFLHSLKFYLTLPLSEEDFLNMKIGSNAASYFVQMCEERKIEVKWNHKLKRVKTDQVLAFENNNKEVDLEYNYSLVMPCLRLPSFIKFSELCKNEQSLEFNYNNFSHNQYQNVYTIGDAMQSGNFLDRFYTNIFHQADILSRNLKLSHFRLNHRKENTYQPNTIIHFDFAMKNYLIFNTADPQSSAKYVKKNFWNNLLFKHLYYRPEGYYCQNILLTKKFGFTFSNKL